MNGWYRKNRRKSFFEDFYYMTQYLSAENILKITTFFIFFFFAFIIAAGAWEKAAVHHPHNDHKNNEKNNICQLIKYSGYFLTCRSNAFFGFCSVSVKIGTRTHFMHTCLFVLCCCYVDVMHVIHSYVATEWWPARGGQVSIRDNEWLVQKK